MAPSPSQQVRVGACAYCACENAKAGMEPGLRPPSDESLDLRQRHFRDRTALGLGPGGRAAFRLRPHRRQLVRLWRDGALEELEAKLVVALLVLVDNDAHVPACFQMSEQH